MRGETDTLNEPIAIVGMSAFFPGAPRLERYWQNLRNGVDAIREVPSTHWDPADHFDADPKAKDMTYGRRGGFLSPVEIDPRDLGVAPRDLEATDTTQILGFVAAQQALADAGYGPDLSGLDRDRCGVILGVTGALELVIPLGARLSHPQWRRALTDAGVDAATAQDVIDRISDQFVDWREASFPGLLGNVAAGRIANRLDLHGTNCVVDAACASSLAALHLAVLELRAGRADVMLCGGVDTFNDVFMFTCFSKTPALSPSGDARPFAASADGTILGEGVGVLVLKRLSDAVTAGDRVYATIRGVGTSSDGRGNAIYAPSAAGQARALRSAYQASGVSPATVELIEAHGTGTRVGDATELEGLISVFAPERPEQHEWCALGSVKSSIGHAKAAAGVAGLMKAALALWHRVIPPTIKVDAPNPVATPGATPFYLPTQARPWFASSAHPRRAGVSAFGFGGSNYHAVLEEAPSRVPSAALASSDQHRDLAEPDWDGHVQIVPFAAPDFESLKRALSAFELAVVVPLGDLNDEERLRWHACRARATFDGDSRAGKPSASADLSARLILVTTSYLDFLARCEQAHQQLDVRAASQGTSSFTPIPSVQGRPPAGEVYLSRTRAAPTGAVESETATASRPRKLALLFPGQGSQYVGMGMDLATRFPECASMWIEGGDAQHAQRIAAITQPPPQWSEHDRQRAALQLQATQHAQPALGRFELGVVRLLERFSLRVDAALGHSFGELVALCAAGHFGADSLHVLAKARGDAMAAQGEGTDPGTMVAVLAGSGAVEEILHRIATDVVIANDNGPTQVVLSGSTQGIELVERELDAARLRSTRLPVAAAFHSPLVAAAAQSFREVMRGVEVAPGGFPVWSNKTAQPYARDGADLRELLAAQLACPVRFRECVEQLLDDGVETFVEVGPDSRLTGLVERIVTASAAHRDIKVVAVDARASAGALVEVARAIACIAARGHEVTLSPWDGRAQDELRVRTQRKVPALTIAISGANLKPKRTPRPPRSMSTELPAHQVPRTMTRAIPDLSRPANLPTAGDVVRGASDRAHDSEARFATQASSQYAAPSAPFSSIVSGARAVDEETRRLGLDALVRLQEQTAHLHQLFLQQQASATRAILGLFDLSQAGAAPRLEAAHTSPTIAATQVAAPPIDPPSRVAPQEASAALGVELGATPRLSPPDPIPTPRPSSHPQVDVASRLLLVVSEKTGYPVEMLEMTMGLDADLGIDSIKRVEILAALQEDLPGTALLRPDQLGELRTLADIVEALLPAGAHRVARAALESTATTARPQVPESVQEIRADLVQSAGAGTDPIESILLTVVADKTGYPVEMLELSMGLDADLGIDSIKRVEILAHLQEQLPYLPALRPDQLGELATLRDIVAALSKGDDRRLVSTSPVSAPAPIKLAQSSAVESPPQAARKRALAPLRRMWVTPTAVPTYAEPRALSPVALGTVWIIGSATDVLAKALVEALLLCGARCELMTLEQAIERRAEAVPSVDLGAIILAPPGEIEDDAWRIAAYGLVVKHARVLMERGARGQSAMLASISRLDGCFGHASMPTTTDGAQGAVCGLVKSAAWEWPGVHARAIDMDPRVPVSAQIDTIVAALLRGGPVEIGVAGGDLTTVTLRDGGEVAPVDPALALRDDDVVLLTGGARGITAAIAAALAEQGARSFALLGRAPGLEASLPDWFVSRTQDSDLVGRSEAQLNAAIIAHEGLADPKALRARRQALLGAWEVRRSIAALESLGAKVLYKSCDVRDHVAVAKAFAEIRARLGRITRVVHGAGVLSDRLLVDKQPGECALVYSTKVGGLRALLAADDAREVQQWVLCSSSTARFGRKGQSDYALANEALVRMALQLRAAGRNALAIDFGPWTGGMVTPALIELFAREGIDPIDLELGAHQVAREMQTRPLDGELVMLGGLTAIESLVPTESRHHGQRRDPVLQTPGAEEPRTSSSILVGTAVRDENSTQDQEPVLLRAISTQTHAVLADHVLDGAAVLPTALALEWMAHAALVRAPGFQLASVSELRVLKGVRISANDVAHIRVHVAATSSGSATNLASGERTFLVEVRSQSSERPHRHFSARMHLVSDALAMERAAAREGSMNVDLAKVAAQLTANGEHRSPSDGQETLLANGHGNRNGHSGGHHAPATTEIYRDLLFHGPALQGLLRIDALSDAGVLATIAASPRPADWMQQPVRSRWILDPLAVDVAFQAVVVWTQRVMGLPSLPTGIERLELFSRFPARDCRVHVRVTSRREHEVIADLEWISSDGRRVATAHGYRSVVDESLRGAYLRRVISSPSKYVHEVSAAPAK